MGSQNNEKTYITKEKIKSLEKELVDLKNVKRKEVLKSLEYARSLGDLSENAEYHQARENQAKLEDRIQSIEAILDNAEVVIKRHSEIARVGSTVIVKKKSGRTKQVFEIVGSEEADMSQGKISHKSPLGQALLGKKKGDTVSFDAPSGVIEYKIVDIE